MVESNTVVSAYMLYRHLQQYCSQPLICVRITCKKGKNSFSYFYFTGHDFKFMKVLAEKGGKTPGMFRYCEPGDSRKALQDKLDELFTFILLGYDNISI